jgi:hypothetical protein
LKFVLLKSIKDITEKKEIKKLNKYLQIYDLLYNSIFIAFLNVITKDNMNDSIHNFKLLKEVLTDEKIDITQLNMHLFEHINEDIKNLAPSKYFEAIYFERFHIEIKKHVKFKKKNLKKAAFSYYFFKTIKIVNKEKKKKKILKKYILFFLNDTFNIGFVEDESNDNYKIKYQEYSEMLLDTETDCFILNLKEITEISKKVFYTIINVYKFKENILFNKYYFNK